MPSVRKRLELNDYVNGIKSSNRVILSQAITLIESALTFDRDLSESLLGKILPSTGNSLRIGITGVPGVGKSTFIESFGLHLCEMGHKVAILAVDPSSQKTRGSILGDKTRMEELSHHKNAFIRPSPTGRSLGGVANKTRETILLCEAAGFDIILIETVGVGQSEVTVKSMVDFFLLLMLAGAGDELQGIKKGIMEMADSIVINKADGDNIKASKQAKTEYQNALHLFPASESGWYPKVMTCSAQENLGLNDVWDTINDFSTKMKETGFFSEQRKRQSIDWMHATIQNHLVSDFFEKYRVKSMLPLLEEKVSSGELTPQNAAHQLLSFRENSAK